MEKIEKNNNIQIIRQEQEKFIYHINEIENLISDYHIEDMGNESSEQEYIMYIEDHCRELRELIDKLYLTKLYIIKNDPVNNNIEFYRDKIGI
jgi:dTDP-D-glucose 4,6-dehydratase